ncbi:MAG: DUF2282 domain-containing protein [Gammaproteobacteria bacterium]|nr:DUF2282 domain-containing protein [Gammaproteobacteria bacterium]
MVKTAFNQIALAAAVAGALGLAASPVFAAEGGKEKCYGVSKAGENDCASAAGTHACSGQSASDYDGQDWKYAAKGTCEQMGGKLEAFKGMGKPAGHG